MSDKEEIYLTLSTYKSLTISAIYGQIGKDEHGYSYRAVISEGTWEVTLHLDEDEMRQIAELYERNHTKGEKE